MTPPASSASPRASSRASSPRERTALRGALFVLAPTALLLGNHTREWMEVAVIAAGIALLAGALLLNTAPRAARAAASAGTIGLAILWTLPRLDRPAWAFVVLMACSALLARIWPPPPLRRAHPATPLLTTHAPDALAALGTLLAVWLVVAMGRLVPGWSHRPELLLASFVPPLLALRYPVEDAERRAGVSVGLMAPTLALLLHPLGLDGGAAIVPPVTAIATWLAVRDPDRPLDVASPWPLLLQHPPRLLVASFAAQCLLGAMVLVLPGLTTLPHGVGFLDALFTAVSATCVTGLTVIDPARDLTMAGQLVLLTLIQVGGLGIMTFSAAALFLMARRMSFRAEATAADLLGADDVAHLGRALLRVLSITFTAEAVGTLALTARFWMAGAAPATALWEGAFTAISAFCNAGFAIQPDNLTRYAEDPVVIHVMSALIILGGLGPAIVTALPELRSRAGRLRLSLHVRLVLGATAALLVLPAAFLAATEWGYALADLAPVDRLHNAWFLSVTTRTAGFYTLDPSRLQRSSVTLLTGLMFVGGAPGSTAGGIKVSTLAVLALAVLAAVRGRAEVEIGQRRIPQDVVYRAGAIASLFLLTVGAALVALQLTQPMSTEALLFEVVSATGTAGLSLGVTPYLDDFGKLVVIACMFAGRVGPLTLFLVLGDTRHPARTIRPAEPVPVG